MKFDLVRILVLGVGAGVGTAMLADSTNGIVAALGFNPESKAGKAAGSGLAAGVGVFVAESAYSALK